MKTFLSHERRTTLAEKLSGIGIGPKHIQMFTCIPDDLKVVDDEMTVHVLTVIECRNLGLTEQSLTGLAVLMTLMEEAKDRGLDECDFPKMLKTTQDDLRGHYGLDEGDIDHLAKRIPREKLQ
jgi:hypothetical protein